MEGRFPRHFVPGYDRASLRDRLAAELPQTDGRRITEIREERKREDLSAR